MTPSYNNGYYLPPYKTQQNQTSCPAPYNNNSYNSIEEHLYITGLRSQWMHEAFAEGVEAGKKSVEKEIIGAHKLQRRVHALTGFLIGAALATALAIILSLPLLTALCLMIVIGLFSFVSRKLAQTH